MTDREAHCPSSSKTHLKDCDYGERCYRQNPAHFREFEHQHLNNLLTKQLDTSTLPLDYNLKVSKKTILEQLNILRALKSSSSNNNTTLNKCTTQDTAQTTENKNINNSFSSASTQHIKRQSSVKDSTSGTLDAKKRKSHDYMDHQTPSPSHSKGSESRVGNKVDIASSKLKLSTDSSIMSNSNSTLSSAEHRKKMQSARTMSEAMSYFQEVKKRSQGDIQEKLKTASPYHFFLTSITDEPRTHKEERSLQLFDILDPSLGDMDSSLQINFMVEFGWLMAQYHVANQSRKPLTLLYGEMDVTNLNAKHITSVQVKPPSPFGSHHTKMCVLAYTDGSVRVCVHTSNLVESDWDNRTQGVWLSPLCPALPLDADSNSGESPTAFKKDLINYLSAYRLPELQPWIGKLRRADFSHINVFFVASVPGSHKGVDADKWGHAKLASLLRQHARVLPRPGSSPSTWQVIAQCSSIGSLGPQPTSWFCGEIKNTMSQSFGSSLQALPGIRLVYPSFNNVADSLDGLLGGGCLPYSRKTHDKQPWLNQYLCQWKCDIRHRTRAMPHIKTYCRVSPDLSQLAWFHLTSANLSKAAWGTQTKAGAISILSYEAGVLFLPKFVVNSTSFPLKNEVANGVPVFPMPYDLPLTPYTAQDVPWFCENLC